MASDHITLALHRVSYLVITGKTLGSLSTAHARGLPLPWCSFIHSTETRVSFKCVSGVGESGGGGKVPRHTSHSILHVESANLSSL